ncbi:hypothetical protein D3C83_180940 [compost metagenome]
MLINKVDRPDARADEVVNEAWRLFQPNVRRRFGLLEWPALLRKLDKVDTSYRN